MIIPKCTTIVFATTLLIPPNGKPTQSHPQHHHSLPQPTSTAVTSAPALPTEIISKPTSAATTITTSIIPKPVISSVSLSVSPSTSSSAPTSAVPPSNPPSNSFKEDMLNGHNFYRSQHGTSNLIWNDAVAASAQQKADKCVFAHDSVRKYGENLAIYSGRHEVSAIIDMWGQERKLYDWNNPVFSMQTGHFTQMIWKGTANIGCAVTNCGGMLGKLYVCHFDAPGNFLGRFANNVANQSIGKAEDTYTAAKAAGLS